MRFHVRKYVLLIRFHAIRCMQGARLGGRVFFKKINNALRGLQEACKRLLRFVKVVGLAFLILFAQFFLRIKKKVVQSIYLTRQGWQILISRIKRAGICLTESCSHGANIAKRFKRTSQIYLSEGVFRIRKRIVFNENG